MRPLISPARRGDPSDREEGFSLIEVVCVVAILTMLAAIAMSRLPQGTSRPRLESYAVAAAAILKGDRNAAIRRQTQIVTEVNAAERLIRSGATEHSLRVPDDVAFDSLLSARCSQLAGRPSIGFFASGMSCGGAITLSRLGRAYEIRVNWLTGMVELVPYNRS